MPLVVDAFGDADTRAAAAHYAQLSNAVRTGFSAKPLFAAIDTLVAQAQTRPIGIVLGSGFEDRPKLIDSLDSLSAAWHQGRNGRGAERPCALLKQLGIAHPATSLQAPEDPTGWIAKRAGGAGGAHIRDLASLRRSHPEHYFQRRR